MKIIGKTRLVKQLITDNNIVAVIDNKCMNMGS